MVCGGGGIFSLSFESDLPINLLQFLELHKEAVDLALFERIIIHRGRGTNFFLNQKGCETKCLVLDMEHKIDSFGLEYKGLLIHIERF